MVDKNGIVFGSRIWMHEKHSLLVQSLGQQGCLKQTHDINWYNKAYMKTYCKHYKTLHCLPCRSNTFTRKYLDLRDTNHANQISTKLYGSSPLIGLNYMMQELTHDLLESSKQLQSIKLSNTMIYKNKHVFSIYHLPHVAFSVSNQIAINEAFNFLHDH